VFLQDGFYFVDGLRVLLLEDLVSDCSREHMAGDVPSRSRWYGKAERYEACEQSDLRHGITVYAISDEQGARKKVLDNRQ
jgi:hypothetical protein